MNIALSNSRKNMDVTLEKEETNTGIQFIASSKKKTFVKGRYTIQLATFRGKVWLHIQGILKYTYLSNFIPFIYFVFLKTLFFMCSVSFSRKCICYIFQTIIWENKCPYRKRYLKPLQCVS